MSRRLLILLALPALALLAALIAWLVAAQLPVWTAPQPDWFTNDTPGEVAADIPGICAAVESLVLYHAQRTDPNVGVGRDKAAADAAQVIYAHYLSGSPDLNVLLRGSEMLAVEATLPGRARQAYYVETTALPNGAAVIYLDATTGDPRALITAADDPAEDCSFNVRAALVAAVKSPPLILLIAYLVIAAGAVAGVLVARRIKGHP